MKTVFRYIEKDSYTISNRLDPKTFYSDMSDSCKVRRIETTQRKDSSGKLKTYVVELDSKGTE